MLFLAILVVLAACGQPVPAPDAAGPSLAVEAARPDGKFVFARAGNIWTWSNGREAQITTSGADTQPRWSPDGSAILFVRNGDSYADLWLINEAGAAPRPLTTNRAAMPPDSRAYVANSALLSGPSWVRTPIGNDTIAYASDRGGGGLALWIAGGPGSRPQPIFGTQSLGGNIEAPALSPDGNRIAFVYDTVDPDGGPRTTQIHVVDLASGQHRPLTAGPGGAYDPAWSPDGQWLAFASRGAEGRETNIWVMRSDGSDRHALTDGGADRAPAWSPDGDRLAFVRHQGDGHALYFVDLSAPGGGLSAGKAQQIAEYRDIDPASGVSWAR